MKPYLIHNTWVNLDDVLAIEERVQIPQSGMCITGRVTLAFHNGPFEVLLGVAVWEPVEPPAPWRSIDEGGKAQSIWDAFITAWKNRDVKPPGSDLPPGYHLGPCPLGADGHAIP